jgi:hypothetical protein
MVKANPEARYWITLRQAETDMINWALEATGWSIPSAATLLGISAALLYSRMEKLDLRPREPRKHVIKERIVSRRIARQERAQAKARPPVPVPTLAPEPDSEDPK